MKEKDMERQTVSRRSFLRLSAALAAGGIMAACAPATPTPAPTAVPKATAVPPTAVPPTAVPKATVAPTAVPPTAAPKATVAPTAVPPTAVPKVAYKEAPMLAELVKAGKLPAVEQRLPKEPLVVKTIEKVGKYGGTIRKGSVGSGIGPGRYMMQSGVMTYIMDGTNYVVDLAKSVTWSPDATKCTVTLREGHKWSDGQPFTADDFMFWWEDLMLNTDITKTVDVFYKPGGKVMEVKKVSPTVVEYGFSIPYPVFGDRIGRTWFSTDPTLFRPKHYLSKWHIKYNPKAEELAKEEKRDTWIQALGAHGGPTDHFEIGRPYVGGWIPEQSSSDIRIAVRNPYFHQVDSEGNQLPYIDRMNMTLVANKEVHALKAAGGDYDFECFNLDLKDMPVYTASKDKGNYRILLPVGAQTSVCFLALNRCVQDPVLNELFNKKDFRIALSVAINRKSINDALFFGLAKPHPVTGSPAMPWHKPEWSTMNIEYDVAKANKLLDGLGLTQKDSEGYRLRPDGKGRIQPLIEVASTEGAKQQIVEMVLPDWKAVGIGGTYKGVDGTLLNQRRLANEVEINTHHSDRIGLFGRANPNFFGWDEPVNQLWAHHWCLWFTSGGKEGIEPPAEIKKLKAGMDEWRKTVPGTPEFNKTGGEYWKYFPEEIPMIGTVGFAPQPMLVNNKLRNVPEKDIWWTSDVNFYQPYWPTQWYFES
jgi:peptide/nickel transport system substrate-binding protein